MTISLIVGLVIVGVGLLALIRSGNKASHHLDHLHVSGDERKREGTNPQA